MCASYIPEEQSQYYEEIVSVLYAVDLRTSEEWELLGTSPPLHACSNISYAYYGTNSSVKDISLTLQKII